MRTECINHQYAFDKPMPVTRLMDQVSNSKIIDASAVFISTGCCSEPFQNAKFRRNATVVDPSALASSWLVSMYVLLANIRHAHDVRSLLLGERNTSLSTVPVGELLFVQIHGDRGAFSIGTNLFGEESRQIRRLQSRWIGQALYASPPWYFTEWSRTVGEGNSVFFLMPAGQTLSLARFWLELCSGCRWQRYALRALTRCSGGNVFNGDRRWWTCTANRSRRYNGKASHLNPSRRNVSILLAFRSRRSSSSSTRW